jgi:hypothetical protein
MFRQLPRHRILKRYRKQTLIKLMLDRLRGSQTLTVFPGPGRRYYRPMSIWLDPSRKWINMCQLTSLMQFAIFFIYTEMSSLHESSLCIASSMYNKDCYTIDCYTKSQIVLWWPQSYYHHSNEHQATWAFPETELQKLLSLSSGTHFANNGHKTSSYNSDENNQDFFMV